MTVEPREVARVHGDGTTVTEVELDDGERAAVGAVFAAGMPTPNSQLAVAVGAEVDDLGFVVTDDFRATTQPGLWAVGDVRTRMHQISMAIADGTLAGGAINALLIEERIPPAG